MSVLNRCIQLAVDCHSGQQYGDGSPYILHALRVMLRLRTTEEMQVGVLHDVLEDTPCTIEDAAKLTGISEEVAEAIVVITRQKERETYREYIDRVAQNPLATRVKIADLQENLSQRPTREQIARYRQALWTLEGPQENGA